MPGTFSAARLIKLAVEWLVDILLFYVVITMPILILLAIVNFYMEFPAFSLSVWGAGFLAFVLGRRL